MSTFDEVDEALIERLSLATEPRDRAGSDASRLPRRRKTFKLIVESASSVRRRSSVFSVDEEEEEEEKAALKSGLAEEWSETGDSPTLQWSRSWAARCCGGLSDGRPKQQQDYITVLLLEETLCLAVFDGHGSKGHKFSSLAGDSLLGCLRGVEGELTQEALKGVFAQLEGKCDEAKRTYGAMSGTTATMLLVQDSRLVVANLGDSVCSFRFYNGDQLLTSFTSVSHDPSLVGEKARIEKAGGLVVTDEGTSRVWLKTADGPSPDGPGLAMSRSLGDATAKTVGVTAEVDVTVFTIPADATRVVAFLCSDGVEDMVPLDELYERLPIAEINESKGDAEQRAAILEKTLTSIQTDAEKGWWEIRDDDEYVDDQSIALIILDRKKAA